MRVYRAELWCDGQNCIVRSPGAPYRDSASTVPDAMALEEVALREGWSQEGQKFYCPKCTRERARAVAATAPAEPVEV